MAGDGMYLNLGYSGLRDGWTADQPSLGEVPHDATGCHNRGRPHLGPCMDPASLGDLTDPCPYAPEHCVLTCPRCIARNWAGLIDRQS
jgi:hypothetical protein